MDFTHLNFLEYASPLSKTVIGMGLRRWGCEPNFPKHCLCRWINDNANGFNGNISTE